MALYSWKNNVKAVMFVIESRLKTDNGSLSMPLITKIRKNAHQCQENISKEKKTSLIDFRSKMTLSLSIYLEFLQKLKYNLTKSNILFWSLTEYPPKLQKYLVTDLSIEE